MTENNTRHGLVRGNQLDRVETLLERYPEASEAEQHEIGQFLKRATPLEVGLLSGNALAWTKVEQYKSDHPHLFATSRRELAVWLGLAAFVAVAVFLLWDVGMV